MEVKEIEINGCISLPRDVSHDQFLDQFIGWVESKGWHFGGGTRQVEVNDHLTL